VKDLGTVKANTPQSRGQFPMRGTEGKEIDIDGGGGLDQKKKDDGPFVQKNKEKRTKTGGKKTLKKMVLVETRRDE